MSFSKERASAVLCYLCETSEGSVALEETNITTLMEPIARRAITAGPNNFVCSGCHDLFLSMKDLQEKYDKIKDETFMLMKTKVARMYKNENPKPFPDKPRYNCTCCDFKTKFPSHPCPEQNKVFTIDFFKDNGNQEQLFQGIVEDSTTLIGTNIIVDGVPSKIINVVDMHGNETPEGKKVLQEFIDDAGDGITAAIVMESSDEKD